MNGLHICEHDLERYHLGMVLEESELGALEEHLLACSDCVYRAEETDRTIDLIRRTLILGNHDLEI